MRWFNNLKISTKLLSGFLLVAIIAGVVGVIGVVNIRNTNTKYVDLYEQYGVALGDMGLVSIQYQISRNYLRDIIFAKDLSEKEKCVAELKEYDAKMQENLLAYEQSISTEEQRREYENIKGSLDSYTPVREQIINHAMANQEEAALAVLKGEGAQTANALKTAVDNLFLSKKATGAELAQEYSDNTEEVIRIMIVIAIFAVFIAVFLGILIARLISKPIKEVVQVVNKVADGDLNVSLQADTNDEVGMLMDAVSKMTDSFNDILTHINASSDQVAAGAKQVSASSTVISQGAAEQASSIEESTVTIKEIANKTQKNAEDAGQADILAEKAIEDAAEGNQRMKEMLTSMEEINTSSNNISKIIKVIDEIAFQTNILALNAAVEAARAGQHGKGFAVVAEEVRNLAARSANAAKETTEMIEGSIQKVHNGTQIANETASALNNIVEEVAKVATIIKNINAASNEQAAGVEQVSQAISLTSEVVQNNSATAQECAAASEELSTLSELLKEQVNKFKLRKSHNSAKRTNDVNPEVLKMLEQMAEKNNANNGFALDELNQGSARKISLSDNEFGKY